MKKRKYKQNKNNIERVGIGIFIFVTFIVGFILLYLLFYLQTRTLDSNSLECILQLIGKLTTHLAIFGIIAGALILGIRTIKTNILDKFKIELKRNGEQEEE